MVYEDDTLIAIDKPSGLLSQPGKTVNDSVVVRVRAARPQASGSMLVHRLDMDTSGVLLLAKTPEAHAAMQQQFEKRQVRKRYRALLEGNMDKAGGVVNLPLRLDVDRRPYQIVCPEMGRAASTVWQRVASRGQYTEVVMLPRTGRTHQLRVHAADRRGLGMPVRGDRLYGEPGERLFLHAEQLTVWHPVFNKELLLTARCPFAADQV